MSNKLAVAMACDTLNAWARECGIDECDDPFRDACCLRDLIEQIWTRVSEEKEEIKDAIRKHRDYEGHDRCWQNDVELYTTTLPGEAIPDRRMPPREEFRRRCLEFEEGQYQNPGSEWIGGVEP